MKEADNKVVKYTLYALNAFLACLECCVKFVTEQSYIRVKTQFQFPVITLFTAYRILETYGVLKSSKFLAYGIGTSVPHNLSSGASR